MIKKIAQSLLTDQEEIDTLKMWVRWHYQSWGTSGVVAPSGWLQLFASVALIPHLGSRPSRSPLGLSHFSSSFL